MSKVEIINEISKLDPTKNVSRLWTYSKDYLIKMLRKLRKELKNE